MTDKLGKFLVVKAEFWYLSCNTEPEAVADAFEYMSRNGNARVLHVVQEIDLSEWDCCPNCGKVVETAIGCWRTPCLEARS